MFQVLQFNTNNSINHQLFVYTQLNDQTVLFQTNHLFALSSNVKQIYLTHIRCYHSGPERTWEQWQCRGTLHPPNPQHYWNFTIWLFGVISRTLVGGGGPYPSAEMQPQLTGLLFKLNNNKNLHTIIWFSVFLSNINNFQTDLLDHSDGS